MNEKVKRDIMGWLYLIRQVNGSGPTKIGWSQNLNTRLAQLNTACPYELEVVYKIRTRQRPVERLVHRSLRKYQLHGEWFDLTPRQIARVIKLLPKIVEKHDPWRDYVSVEEAARILGISTRQAYRAVHSGRIPARVLPGRRYGVVRASIAAPKDIELLHIAVHVDEWEADGWPEVGALNKDNEEAA